MDNIIIFVKYNNKMSLLKFKTQTEIDDYVNQHNLLKMESVNDMQTYRSADFIDN